MDSLESSSNSTLAHIETIMAVKDMAVSLLETTLGLLILIVTSIDWAFTEYLLVSNIVSAGLLLALGDFTVQTMDMVMSTKHSGRKYDPVRNGRTLAVGFVLGVFTHYWYVTLEDFLHGQTLDIVVKKMAWDQAIAGPFFSSAFLIGMGRIENQPFSDIFKEWKSKFLSIHKVDWIFWPAAQFINFYLIPNRFRVFYVNLATFLWTASLCYVKDVKDEAGTRRPRSKTDLSYHKSWNRARKSPWSSSGRSKSESPSWGHHRPSTRSKSYNTKPRMRLTKKTHNTDKRGSWKLKSLDGPEKEKIYIHAAVGERDATTKRIKKYVQKKKKKIMREETSAINLKPEKSNSRLKQGVKTSGKTVPDLAEIRQLVLDLSNQITTNQTVLERYLMHTSADIAKLQSMCSYLNSIIEETKRGAVNIALQITQMVKEERQQCMEDVRHTMADMLIKLEILVQGLGEEEKTVSLVQI